MPDLGACGGASRCMISACAMGFDPALGNCCGPLALQINSFSGQALIAQGLRDHFI